MATSRRECTTEVVECVGDLKVVSTSFALAERNGSFSSCDRLVELSGSHQHVGEIDERRDKSRIVETERRFFGSKRSLRLLQRVRRRRPSIHHEGANQGIGRSPDLDVSAREPRTVSSLARAAVSASSMSPRQSTCPRLNSPLAGGDNPLTPRTA